MKWRVVVAGEEETIESSFALQVKTLGSGVVLWLDVRCYTFIFVVEVFELLLYDFCRVLLFKKRKILFGIRRLDARDDLYM